MRRFVVCVFLIFIAFGCIDRLYYDVALPSRYGLSISGHITDNGGPHRVYVYRNFDIESRDSLKTGVTAKSVVISDIDGNSATLSQGMSGVYETKAGAIVGKIGGIYKVVVELDDGRVYESFPDTLWPGGVIDTAYYEFVGRATVDNYVYQYEIYNNSRATGDLSKTFFMWSSKMTYKATTQPELESVHNSPCYPQPEKPTLCNTVAPCSGYKNLGSNYSPDLVPVGPCTCCTCWYEQYSPFILLSDNYLTVNGHYNGVLVDRIRQTGWNMMYKMRIEVTMQSISSQAYRFWKGVRDQRSATTNIFQPITGKIPGNIIQTKGPEAPSEGIFYATSASKKVFYIRRGDTPANLIPSVDFEGAGWFPCQRLAPNAQTTAPDYWVE